MIEKRDFLNLTKIGPAGGYGGEEFDDESKAKILDNKVNRIHVMSGRYIDCLDIQYKYGGCQGFLLAMEEKVAQKLLT